MVRRRSGGGADAGFFSFGLESGGGEPRDRQAAARRGEGGDPGSRARRAAGGRGHVKSKAPLDWRVIDWDVHEYGNVHESREHENIVNKYLI